MRSSGRSGRLSLRGVVFTLAFVAAAAGTSCAAPAGERAGGAIAFSVEHGDGDSPWDIYIVRTDGRWISRKTTQVNESQPVWSPDGRHLAYLTWPQGHPSNDCVSTMRRDGTGRRCYAEAANSSPRWSPDGRQLTYAYDGIYVINADGTGKRRLTRTGIFLRDPTVASDSDPAWSPNGKQIAFTHYRAASYSATVYVINADGTGRRRVTDGEVQDWTPGRRIIISRARGIYVVEPDGSGLRKVVPTEPNERDVGGWSPDGRLIVLGNGISTVRPSDLSTRRLTRYGVSPAWSPDGRQIVFTRAFGTTSTDGLWVIDRDGSHARRVAAATSGDWYSEPAWYGVRASAAPTG